MKLLLKSFAFYFLQCFNCASVKSPVGPLSVWYGDTALASIDASQSAGAWCPVEKMFD